MIDLNATLQLLAPVGALAVFGWGVFQFHRSTELSFRKPFWEVQLALYREATSATGTLAGTESESDWNAAAETFWRLYFGPLCLVEDRGVEAAMVQFAGTLEDASFERRDARELGSLSLQLAAACRSSIGSGLRLSLPQLAGRESLK